MNRIPQGMTAREYARHEFGKSPKPKFEVGAVIQVAQIGEGTITKIAKEKTSVGMKTFVYFEEAGATKRFRLDSLTGFGIRIKNSSGHWVQK